MDAPAAPYRGSEMKVPLVSNVQNHQESDGEEKEDERLELRCNDPPFFVPANPFSISPGVFLEVPDIRGTRLGDLEPSFELTSRGSSRWITSDEDCFRVFADVVLYVGDGDWLRSCMTGLTLEQKLPSAIEDQEDLYRVTSNRPLCDDDLWIHKGRDHVDLERRFTPVPNAFGTNVDQSGGFDTTGVEDKLDLFASELELHTCFHRSSWYC